MNRYLLLILIFLLSCQKDKLDSKKSYKAPDKTFDGNAYLLLPEHWESIRKIGKTPTGNLVIVGDTKNGYAIAEINESAEIQWEKFFERGLVGGLNDLIYCEDGGWLTGGSVGGGSNMNGLLLKLDSNGELVWQNTFGGNDLDRIYAIAELKEQEYIFAGIIRGFAGGNGADFFIGQANESLTQEWIRIFDFSFDDWALDIAVLSEKEFIVGGQRQSPTGLADSLILQKMTNEGNLLWSKTYSHLVGYPIPELEVIPTADGGVLVSASSFAPSTFKNDLLAIKLDQDGNEIWSACYGGEETDRANSVLELTDGGFLILGDTQSYDSGIGDFYLTRIDDEGRQLWSNTYGGTFNETAYDMLQLEEETIVIVGFVSYENKDGTLIFDAVLLKIDLEGNPK